VHSRHLQVPVELFPGLVPARAQRNLGDHERGEHSHADRDRREGESMPRPRFHHCECAIQRATSHASRSRTRQPAPTDGADSASARASRSAPATTSRCPRAPVGSRWSSRTSLGFAACHRAPNRAGIGPSSGSASGRPRARRASRRARGCDGLCVEPDGHVGDRTALGSRAPDRHRVARADRQDSRAPVA